MGPHGTALVTPDLPAHRLAPSPHPGNHESLHHLRGFVFSGTWWSWGHTERGLLRSAPVPWSHRLMALHEAGQRSPPFSRRLSKCLFWGPGLVCGGLPSAILRDLLSPSQQRDLGQPRRRPDTAFPWWLQIMDQSPSGEGSPLSAVCVQEAPEAGEAGDCTSEACPSFPVCSPRSLSAHLKGLCPC